jgi:hypothetical protein
MNTGFISNNFEDRLNQILPKVTSGDFLNSRGLGNEIGFWVFDYPPERELDMRQFLSSTIEPALTKAGTDYSACHRQPV